MIIIFGNLIIINIYTVICITSIYFYNNPNYHIASFLALWLASNFNVLLIHEVRTCLRLKVKLDDKLELLRLIKFIDLGKITMMLNINLYGLSLIIFVEMNLCHVNIAVLKHQFTLNRWSYYVFSIQYTRYRILFLMGINNKLDW